jgi:hypothetical protein
MSSIGERTDSRNRQRHADKREIAFFVRAKTGPGPRDWSAVGVAFNRKDGQPGFSVKLNTLPISREWSGTLVLVPPFEEEDAPIDE